MYGLLLPLLGAPRYPTGPSWVPVWVCLTPLWTAQGMQVLDVIFLGLLPQGYGWKYLVLRHVNPSLNLAWYVSDTDTLQCCLILTRQREKVGYLPSESSSYYLCMPISLPCQCLYVCMFRDMDLSYIPLCVHPGLSSRAAGTRLPENVQAHTVEAGSWLVGIPVKAARSPQPACSAGTWTESTGKINLSHLQPVSEQYRHHMKSCLYCGMTRAELIFSIGSLHYKRPKTH